MSPQNKTGAKQPVNHHELVALSRLIPSPKNVRRYESDAGIAEFAADISAHGLINALRVRTARNGKLEVVAGARRLKALHTLQKTKAGAIKGVRVTGNTLVPVSFQGEDDNDTEISLAENFARTDMHAADEVTAFAELAQAMTPEQIGDRFGISHLTVRRRLKLARVSPKIMDEFRVGSISHEQMQALAVSDDHEEQERVWYEAQHPWQRQPHVLKARLTDDHIRGSDRLARFVTVKAYEEAGGAVIRDLFATEDEVFLTDRALFFSLLDKRLAPMLRELGDEGWKWAEFSAETQATRFLRIRERHFEPSTADAAELSRLGEEYDALEDQWRRTGEDDEEALEQLSPQIEAIRSAIEDLMVHYRGFDQAEMRLAGVLVTINHAGEVHAHRGCVKAEDVEALQALQRGVASDAGSRDSANRAADNAATGDEAPALSMAIVEDLTALRTAALAVEVSSRPDMALCIAIHALARTTLYGHGGFGEAIETASEITVRGPYLQLTADDLENHGAFGECQRIGEEWRQRLPEKHLYLWAWLTGQDRATLLDLLAYLVGMSVNAWRQRHARGSRFTHADQIAEAVGLDMRKYWRPSEAFMKRVPISYMTEAMAATQAPEAMIAAAAKAKKADVIAAALSWLPDTGWLPEPLRSQEPVTGLQDGTNSAQQAMK